MENNIQLLHTTWEQTKKTSTQQTSLDSINFDQITSEIFSLGSFYYYVIDFFDMSLSHVSKSVYDIHGLNPDSITFNDIISTIHPDDISFVAQAEESIAQFFYNNIGKEKLTKYKTSYNFRSKMKNGEYGMLNHQALILTQDEKGGFAKSLNIHTDISHLTKINNYQFSLIGLQEEPTYTNIDVKVSSKNLDMHTYTKRERDILKLLSEGFNSNRIADSLSISLNTVKNHRKNILRKSDCKNTVELVKALLVQGVI